MRVALIAAHEGTDHLRGQQPDLVAESQQPARPVLRAAARLHRDQARRAIDEVFQELRPRQPQVHNLARLHIDPVQLKHPLCQSACKIDPLSACNIDPLSGTAEVVPVVNRGDPSGFV